MLRLHDPVVYVDTHGICRGALLTTIWASIEGVKNTLDASGNVIETDYPNPTVNVVYLSGDPARTDNGGSGRQIERASSVVHMSNQSVFGNYWRRLSETGKESEQTHEMSLSSV